MDRSVGENLPRRALDSDRDGLRKKRSGFPELVISADDFDHDCRAVKVIAWMGAPEKFLAVRDPVAVSIGIGGLVETAQKLHLPAVVHSVVIGIKKPQTNLLGKIEINAGQGAGASIAPGPHRAIRFHGERMSMGGSDGDDVC